MEPVGLLERKFCPQKFGEREREAGVGVCWFGARKAVGYPNTSSDSIRPAGFDFCAGIGATSPF